MSKILQAAEQGKSELVKSILESDPTQVHVRNPESNQPLHLAAWQGRAKVAEVLLQYGADINASGDQGRTPLHYALAHNCVGVAKLLIKHGANVNLRDSVYCAPLYLAASVGDEKMVKQLLIAGAEKDINSSIYLDEPNSVIRRLEAAPELLSQLTRPETLLTDAIRVESVDLAEYLLSHGVNPNSIGWTRLLPLFDAISRRNVGLVRALLSHGADVNSKDHVGRGVLAFAHDYKADHELIGLLEEFGATA